MKRLCDITCGWISDTEDTDTGWKLPPGKRSLPQNAHIAKRSPTLLLLLISFPAPNLKFVNLNCHPFSFKWIIIISSVRKCNWRSIISFAHKDNKYYCLKFPVTVSFQLVSFRVQNRQTFNSILHRYCCEIVWLPGWLLLSFSPNNSANPSFLCFGRWRRGAWVVEIWKTLYSGQFTEVLATNKTTDFNRKVGHF